ncbi:MAG: hypothetical protein KC503_01515, partial [Myxococcales bacterium]|nr:hypothetical protein [Myxococcales bacterium]
MIVRAFAVGLAQTLPLAMSAIALPSLLLARGLSLEEAHRLVWLALPVLGAALWAPLIDRMRAARGEQRTLAGLLALLLATLLALPFIVARFASDPQLVQAALLAAVTAGATASLAGGAALVTAATGRAGAVAASHAGAYAALALCALTPWLRARAGSDSIVLLVLAAASAPALLSSLLSARAPAARDQQQRDE